MKLLSFFRRTPQPTLQLIPSNDLFRRLRDPHYRELDELVNAPVGVSPSRRSAPTRQRVSTALPQ